MVEISRHWGGTTVGDCGNYDDDAAWSDIMRKLFASVRATEGVVARYSSGLAMTDIGAQTVRVAPGMAIVDGKFYESDANEDTILGIPGAGTDYYLLVLRKDFLAQTVRQFWIGPVAGGPAPPPVQVDGTTWDLPLAEVRITNAGVITVLDQRKAAHTGLAGQVLIEEQLLAASAASVTFSNIPPFFRHLKIELQARVTTAVAFRDCNMQFNGDAGNNYDYRNVFGAALAQATIIFYRAPGAAAPANVADGCVIEIANYARTVFQKSIISSGSLKTGVGIVADLQYFWGAGWWRSAAAINSITLFPTVAAQWDTGTIISLYGVP